MAAAVDANYLKEIEKARRDLRALISSKNCAPIMLQSCSVLPNGVAIILPFVASDSHRSAVLRILSSLIIEDVTQAYPKNLDLITSFRLKESATLLKLYGALSGSINQHKRVFGEATGFSLLLTTLHSFQRDEECTDGSQSLLDQMKVFAYLFCVGTAGVCGGAANRVAIFSESLTAL